MQAAGAMSPKRTETNECKLDIWTWAGNPGHNTILCFTGIRVSADIRLLPSRTLSQTMNLEKFRHGTSTVASVINLVRLSTVASVSH